MGTTRAIRSSIAAAAAAMLALTGLTGLTGLAAVAQADTHDLVLDPAALEPQDDPQEYREHTELGRFIIAATDTHEVRVVGHEREGAGGHEFTHRLELRGSGTAEYRSVHFDVDEPSTLVVHTLSGSGDADRDLALFDADGTEAARLTAYADPGPQIPAGAIVVPEAGSYYLASTDSGINIYRMELRLGELPERAPWDEVADPAITEVELDPADAATLLVSFGGVVGADGADVATAALLNDDGEPVATGMSATAGASGQIALTPPASGSFDAQVTLSRAGEEDKHSELVVTTEFVLPLGIAQIHSVLTSAIDGDEATVTVGWAEVDEAEHYELAYRETGEEDFLSADTGITDTEADVTGLTPGQSYDFAVRAHRGEESTVSEAFEATVAESVERWLSAHAGVGSGGEVTEHLDGSLTIDAVGNNGKIADSEDGFLYYYTEIDPETENFTLTATFTVDDASGKDNQSGFGVIAVDDFIPGNPTARYFNSAGAMAAKYTQTIDGTSESRYGTPGGKFVTGYTGPPTASSADRDMSASQAFDWDYKADYTEGPNLNPPKFTTGEVYEFSLRASNTGFHALTTLDGQEHEVIHYDPDLLLQQSGDSYYVGIFATRGITVSVTDIEFTTIHPEDDDEAQEPPTTYITPELNADVTRTTPHTQVQVPLTSNVYGEAVLVDFSGEPVAGPVDLSPAAREMLTLDLVHGTNEFTARLSPAPRQEQTHLGDYEDLTSYDDVEVGLTFTVDRFGEPGQAIYVAPEGDPGAAGTPDDPLDLHTAVAYVQPGQQIVLLPGTYRPASAVVIERGNNGTAQEPITMLSEPGSRAVLDLMDSATGGINLRGDHWHLYDLEITNSQGYRKPLLISGHHNVIERIESHHNADTGIQISGSSLEPPAMWPSHNLVLSSVAHNNADPLANDADGFAAKLTVGEGNVFRYNIAHHNIDDGWDLYAKSTEGPIGAVVIEDSVSYNNGWLEADEDLELTGEGNGFKLGGESMPGAHILRNSVSYNNLAKGATSNSGPDVRLADITTYYNGHVVPDLGRMNIQLTTNADQTDYRASGVISYQGQQADDIMLKDQDDAFLTDPSNYFDGRSADPVAGLAGGVRTMALVPAQDRPAEITDDWFVSLDFDSIRPTIAADGSIDMGGLLELTDLAPADTGARLGANPNPTQIELLPPVSATGDDGDDNGNAPGGESGNDHGTSPTDPGASNEGSGSGTAPLPAMGVAPGPALLAFFAAVVLSGVALLSQRRRSSTRAG